MVIEPQFNIINIIIDNINNIKSFRFNNNGPKSKKWIHAYSGETDFTGKDIQVNDGKSDLSTIRFNIRAGAANRAGVFKTSCNPVGTPGKMSLVINYKDGSSSSQDIITQKNRAICNNDEGNDYNHNIEITYELSDVLDRDSKIITIK